MKKPQSSICNVAAHFPPGLGEEVVTVAVQAEVAPPLLATVKVQVWVAVGERA
jgi:hypothetical protein